MMTAGIIIEAHGGASVCINKDSGRITKLYNSLWEFPYKMYARDDNVDIVKRMVINKRMRIFFIMMLMFPIVLIGGGVIVKNIFHRK